MYRIMSHCVRRPTVWVHDHQPNQIINGSTVRFVIGNERTVPTDVAVHDDSVSFDDVPNRLLTVRTDQVLRIDPYLFTLSHDVTYMLGRVYMCPDSESAFIVNKMQPVHSTLCNIGSALGVQCFQTCHLTGHITPFDPHRMETNLALVDSLGKRITHWLTS